MDQPDTTKDVEETDVQEESAEEKKPEKIEIRFEGTMPLEEAVSYFEALVGGLRKGTINLKQGEESLTLIPQPFLDVEVKAVRKKNKEKISFELQWRPPADSELSITSQQRRA